ncbi:MAG: hypothetical protein WC095_00385 [Candidatus Paceibacterota bacterium]
MSKNILKKIGFILLVIFAIIGASFIFIYFAVLWGFTDTKGIIDRQREVFLESGKEGLANTIDSQNTDNYWQKTEEWQVIKTALLKDKDVLYRAALSSGVSPRLIASQLIVEQLRMFNSDRESYKKFFEPLKILGSQTKFSWGVMGMKEDTAITVEQNLKNPESPFYLGIQFENILNFQTENIKEERFTRMTDQRNHYFSYLYAGIYLKQIMSQWEKAGFPISNRPEILSTLYNIGFVNSKPNPDPKSGGALIEIGNRTYSFGSLAKEFYYSDELLLEFPR